MQNLANEFELWRCRRDELMREAENRRLERVLRKARKARARNPSGDWSEEAFCRLQQTQLREERSAER